MLFSYGNGEYVEQGKVSRGEIVLGDHKLYLRSGQGDITRTYIPLEKIERVKRNFQGLEVHVRPSVMASYVALIRGDRRNIKSLIQDLAKRRGLVKRFWKREWYDNSFFDR